MIDLSSDLPPLGVECEYYNGCSLNWEHCTVVAHHDGGAVAAVHEDDLSYSYHYGVDGQFRPINSNREKALAEMWEIMNDNANYGLGGMSGALYDAGWRKRMSREEAEDKIKFVDMWTGPSVSRILDALGFKE